MKAKGFTLIELLAVIIILGVLLTITITAVDVIIKNSKSSLSENQKKRVEEAAEIFYINEGTNLNTTCVDVQYLTENGYIEGNDVIDPKTKESLGGSVKIEKNLNQYTYEYQEDTCPPLSFSDDSWDTIAANVKAGRGDVYEVGDTKEVTLSGAVNGTFTVRIANTSTPEECKGAGFSQTACGFVVEFVDIISNQQVNASNTNAGGWQDSAMRSYLNVINVKDGSGTIFNALPAELQNVIIDTTVVSGHETGKSSNYVTTDKLYLLSGHEVYKDGEINNNMKTYDTSWENTRQLDYYQEKGVTSDSDKYAPAIKNFGGSASPWWLRSVLSSDTTVFFVVDTLGGWNGVGASNSYGVAPAFRLG